MPQGTKYYTWLCVSDNPKEALGLFTSVHQALKFMGLEHLPDDLIIEKFKRKWKLISIY